MMEEYDARLFRPKRLAPAATGAAERPLSAVATATNLASMDAPKTPRSMLMPPSPQKAQDAMLSGDAQHTGATMAQVIQPKEQQADAGTDRQQSRSVH